MTPPADDRRVFLLEIGAWEAFDAAWQRPAREVPGLRDLLKTPAALDMDRRTGQRMSRLAPYRKFLVAAVTVLAQIVSLNLASGDTQKWLTVALAAAGALGVYATPNTQV